MMNPINFTATVPVEIVVTTFDRVDWMYVAVEM